MKQLDKAPFDLVVLNYLTVFDKHPVHPFRYLTQFGKSRPNLAENISARLRQEYAEITAYMDSLDINYAILMVEGYVVFTEDPLDLNAMIVKLSTGLDIKGQFEFHLTPWLRQERVTDIHNNLLRE